MTPAPPALAVPAPAIDRLFAQAEAGRWGVTAGRFEEAVRAAVARLAPGDESAAAAAVAGLHAQDLALPLACAAAHPGTLEDWAAFDPDELGHALALQALGTGSGLIDIDAKRPPGMPMQDRPMPQVSKKIRTVL